MAPWPGSLPPGPAVLVGNVQGELTPATNTSAPIRHRLQDFFRGLSGTPAVSDPTARRFRGDCAPLPHARPVRTSSGTRSIAKPLTRRPHMPRTAWSAGQFRSRSLSWQSERCASPRRTAGRPRRQPSAILRLTAEHSPGGAYPANVAAYINGCSAAPSPPPTTCPPGSTSTCRVRRACSRRARSSSAATGQLTPARPDRGRGGTKRGLRAPGGHDPAHEERAVRYGRAGREPAGVVEEA